MWAAGAGFLHGLLSSHHRLHSSFPSWGSCVLPSPKTERGRCGSSETCSKFLSALLRSGPLAAEHPSSVSDCKKTTFDTLSVRKSTFCEKGTGALVFGSVWIYYRKTRPITAASWTLCCFFIPFYVTALLIRCDFESQRTKVAAQVQWLNKLAGVERQLWSLSTYSHLIKGK